MHGHASLQGVWRQNQYQQKPGVAPARRAVLAQYTSVATYQKKVNQFT